MGKGEQTRDRILTAALKRTARDGLGAVTVGSAAAELAMSKSGVFAHFGSKEALQYAIVEQAIDHFRTKVIEPGLRQANPRRRLDALIDGYIAWMDGDDSLEGCPFVSALQEFRDRHGVVRDRLVEAQRAWRVVLADIVAEAQRDGAIARSTSPDQIVFELIGAILSYQISSAILHDGKAHVHVRAAIHHILNRA